MSDKPKQGDVQTILEPECTERRMVVTGVDEGVRIGGDAVSVGYTLAPAPEGFLEKLKQAALEYSARAPEIARAEAEAAYRSGYRWSPSHHGFPFPLTPAKHGKRGQKLNRGGRRRARAKHAEKMARRPPHVVEILVQGGDGADGGVPEGIVWRRPGRDGGQ